MREHNAAVPGTTPKKLSISCPSKVCKLEKQVHHMNGSSTGGGNGSDPWGWSAINIALAELHPWHHVNHPSSRHLDCYIIWTQLHQPIQNHLHWNKRNAFKEKEGWHSAPGHEHVHCVVAAKLMHQPLCLMAIPVNKLVKCCLVTKGLWTGPSETENLPNKCKKPTVETALWGKNDVVVVFPTSAFKDLVLWMKQSSKPMPQQELKKMSSYQNKTNTKHTI